MRELFIFAIVSALFIGGYNMTVAQAANMTDTQRAVCKVLSKDIEKVQRSVPRRVDEATMLRSVLINCEHKSLHYQYHIEFSAALLSDNWRDIIVEQAYQTFCLHERYGKPEVLALISDWWLVYRYYDVDKVFIGAVEMNFGEMCGKAV